MSYSRIKHITIPGLRLHLRRGEPNMLWVNGQNLLLLNDTAADFIETFIEVMANHPESLDVNRFKAELVARMNQKYPKAPADVLLRDFDNIYGNLLEIGKGSCPISEVKLDTREINPQKWTAPPRMDLALTYRCNNNCYYCYTGGPQKVSELDTANWKRAIDTLWDNGPVIISAEASMREWLATHAAKVCERPLEHFASLRQRLSQNNVQEKLTKLWIDRALRQLGWREHLAAE